MSRKLKFALLALLGFSTACSTVKSVPKDHKDKKETSLRPHIIVMYGARPPLESPKELDQATPAPTPATSDKKE